MNLGGHRTRRRAGARARSPLAPSSASVVEAGSETPAMGAKRGSGGAQIDGRKATTHPYLARQMSDLGFQQNP